MTLPLQLRQALARVHDRTASETDLQRVTMRYGRDHGWRAHHSLPARVKENRWVTALQGDPGIMDCIMVRGGRLVVAELKREKGSTSPAQDGWLDAFRLVPCAEVYVWRPRDWPEIRSTLI